MNEEIVRFSHVNSEFGEKGTLKDFSFQLLRGEIVSFLGTRRSGIECIPEIVEGGRIPEQGRMDWRGVRREDWHVDLSRYVIIDQRKRLFNNLNLSQNILLHVGRQLHSYKVGKPEQEALAAMELCKPLHASVAELSIIERNQFQLALALMKKADLFFLNSVGCSYGEKDYKILERCILRMKECGIGILLIQDKPTPLLNWSDRILLFKSGRVIKQVYRDRQEANIKEIFQQINQWDGKEKGVGTRIPLPDDQKGRIIGLYDTQWKWKTKLTDYLSQVSWGEAQALGDFVNACKRNWVYVPENSADYLDDRMDIGHLIVQPSYRKASNLFGVVNEKLVDYTRIEFLQQQNLPEDIRSLQDLKYSCRKILSIYRWVMRSPQLLLLENPYFQVDVSDVEQVRAYVKGIRGKCGCILASSNEIEDLLGLCDQVILLSRNRVRGIFQPKEYSGIMTELMKE